MSKNKKRRKTRNQRPLWVNLVTMLCFIAVLAGSMFGLGEWFRDKNSSLDKFYLQPDNTIDALIVGSSHVYSGYVPAILWREYGVSAYNAYAWYCPIWTAYYNTKEALQTQDVDVIFLDVSSVVYGVGIDDMTQGDEINLRENTRQWNPLYRFGARMASASVNGEALSPGAVTDIALYHNKWRFPDMLFAPFEPETQYSYFRNFGPRETHLEYEIFDYSFYQGTAEPSPKARAYLDKYIELSQQENFRLVFILTPYSTNEAQTYIFNWLHAYAKECGIDFIDFLREDGVACGFDMQYDMADPDHAHFLGAFKLTRYLGEYLNSIGYVAGSNSNSAQLDTDADECYRLFAIWEAEEAEKLAALTAENAGETD